MTEITDDFMTQMLFRARDYCIVILKAGPNHSRPGAEKIIWEHARRNFLLRARGLLPIVCPITYKSDLAGIGIFNADIDLAKSIMDQDPAVKEGIFVYEAHTCRGFPGDCLTAEEIGDENMREGSFFDKTQHSGSKSSQGLCSCCHYQNLDERQADSRKVRDNPHISMHTYTDTWYPRPFPSETMYTTSSKARKERTKASVMLL